MSSSVVEKMIRLRAGEPPRVLDLFSGCGGLMLGFHRAGCESFGGVELDADAAASYALNFHGGSAIHGKSRDITKLNPQQLLRQLGHVDDETPDLIIGGPPCTAFTRVGRAKLRDVYDDPEAHLNDPRAKLYLKYLSLVRALKPIALLMENVPDVLNFGGRNLGEEISRTLEAEGYACVYTLLNAASYGVPQLRERFFLIGIRKEIDSDFTFPAPSCGVHFPLGYHSSRNVALKRVREAESGHSLHFVDSPRPALNAGRTTTVREAIADLPRLRGSESRRRAQRLQDELPYLSRATLSAYADGMRAWPGFEGAETLRDHVTRALTERDFRLFAAMEEGDDYPRAIALAETLFRAAVISSARSGRTLLEGSAPWKQLRREYVPPYDVSKFPNRWRKMEARKPARTLMAHLGKDSYSHIHYDSDQARTLTVREAARLQSFPDGFRFAGTMNPAFRQIGNAVPPLVAFALARSLLKSLGASVEQREQSAEALNRASGS